MPIDNDTKEQFTNLAKTWLREQHPQFYNVVLGEVKPVTVVTYNKEEGHPERLPDGLVVPILCANCGDTMAHYSDSTR